MRSVQEIRHAGAAWVTETELEWLCDEALRADDLKAALERVAAPRRTDGTYNLSREACEVLARKALGWGLKR